MTPRPNKVTKAELRKETRLTRPPRLEGKVKEANMQPVRKPKHPHAQAKTARKAQGYSDQERKDYQLKSKHHG